MGELDEDSNAIPGWRSGTVFTFQHGGGVLVIGVGTFWCTKTHSKHSNPQTSGVTSKQRLQDYFSGYFAQYSENIRMSLKGYHKCS